MSQFICDPDAPYWGFASWNNFFTRQFRPGERPVAEPDDNKVIVSACEASPYNIQHDVKLHDQFWIKSQPYSLQEMFTTSQHALANNLLVAVCIRLFLARLTITAGTRRSVARSSRRITSTAAITPMRNRRASTPAGLNDSQGYTTAIAARAVIVIDCDDPRIGLVGCIFVGMADVSSCVIEALPGQRVAKGDELGYFQYGGSTYCLVFQPAVVQSFMPHPPFDDAKPPLHVNACVAKAR